ncbi:DNA-binding transcriptional LysR family regulator [Vreelandella songnenensis]|uniref:DNA-binding transcriptional LysR family regulator n=1 Tax=Vreelandella songnenensis TaxID=1176243 RepID=A0A2T0V029_9GAMM|nr:LysR family transcriptional regulator [Halomonas songnenensis]PRY63506.1 DNA-binding transcriptional LysR family regulator [Halomonas songnenensis]
MDFKRLNYFQIVVEEGSITAAAKRIPLAQPALTRQLQLLEEEVGTTLLNRSRTGVRLTMAGKAFYRDTRKLLSEFEQAKRSAQRISEGQLGQLHLGVTVMHLWVPQITALLNAFRERYPEVSLKVDSLLSAPQVEAIRREELDAGILFFPPDDETLCSHCLYEDHLVLVTSATSRLARHPPQKLSDLNNEEFIWFDRSATPTYHDKLIHAFQRADFTPHVVQEGTDNATMLCLVAAGMGCTILPAMTMAGAPEGVVSHRVSDLDLKLPLMLVWRRDSGLSAVQKFIEIAEGRSLGMN